VSGTPATKKWDERCAWAARACLFDSLQHFKSHNMYKPSCDPEVEYGG
jgi:hypothetical protein